MYVTRVDDSDGVVRQRLTVYLEETEPLVNYYDGRPTFFRINGFQPPAAVTAQVRDALARVAARSSAAPRGRPTVDSLS